jgi:hypothetical protein
MSSNPDYNSPVSALLQLGDPDDTADWAAYLEMGITAEHVAELGQMATDQELCESDTDFEYWAPVHAWHALSLFSIPESVQSLITALAEFSDNPGLMEWTGEDLTAILGRIGGVALPGLVALLGDDQQTDMARENAVLAITAMYQQHPETQPDCIAALTQQLSKFAQNEPGLNGYLVTSLVADFKAVESAALIEEAYASERVDEAFIGDWAEAQVELGLKTAAEVAKPLPNVLAPQAVQEPVKTPSGGPRISKDKVAAKRKLQKQARKQNRPKKKKK